MRTFQLDGVKRLVVLGAHPDDIEIAAGGTLLTLAAVVPDLHVRYVLFTGEPHRQQEAREAAAKFLAGASVEVDLHDLPDGRLPQHWGAAKAILEQVAAAGPADLVLAPARDDAHQDHRTVAELVPTVFRQAPVLHYEIPKWDGDLGRPNTYLPLDEATIRRKIELLDACFPSQKGRHWWDEEVFLGLARLRGVECRHRYAEAFTCYKSVVRIPVSLADGV